MNLQPLAARLAAIVSLPLTIAVMTAPAATADEPVNVRAINGYVVIDEQHIALRGGASRTYLVTLRRRCLGLRGSTRIGTSFENNGRITMPRAEYILNDRDRCYLDSIEQVESVDAARALVAERAEDEQAS